MGGVFEGALDFVLRMVGLWMIYGVTVDYIPAVIYRVTGKREFPMRLQKPFGHFIHIGSIFVGWWLLSH